MKKIKSDSYDFDISVITPCFNEVENISKCVESLQKIMKIKLPLIKYEHIVVDNQSTDGTLKILKELQSRHNNLRILVNSRNVGVAQSIYGALKLTNGGAVIPMLPADLQDPVEVIPEFYKKWESGTKIIFGLRKSREEAYFMRLLRKIYYETIQKFSESNIPPDAGDFMLVDSAVMQTILELDDSYPYIRGLVAQAAAPNSTDFVEYTWKKRIGGKSKSSVFVLVDTAINGLVSTSRVPARISLIAGFLFSFLGFCGALITLFNRLLFDFRVTPGIPTVVIALFVLGGIQLFFLGLIGEYVLSIHGNVRRQPRHIVFEVKGSEL